MRLRTITLVLAAAAICPSAVTAQLARAAADSAWLRGDRDTARGLYQVRLAADQADAVALFRLALLAGWDRDFDRSLTYLDRLIGMHPTDRDAKVARANAIAAMGDLDRAIAAVDSILVTHPDDGGAVQARARFAARERQLDLSERLWRHALELDNRSPAARLGLSQVLRWKGRSLEARSVIRPAAESSNDIDVRNESDNVERLYSPRVRSGLTFEEDSDGNRIATMTAGGAFRLTDRVDVRTDGYYRAAALDAAAEDVAARGAHIGLAFEAQSGWVFNVATGASASDIAGSAVRPNFSGGLTTPRHNTAVLGFSASRSTIDYTLPLVRNDVAVTEARATLDTRAGRDWTFTTQASIAAFNVRSVAESSRRLSGKATAYRRLNDPFALIFAVWGFGFDRDLNGGFFDPSFYGLADAAIAWHNERPAWMFDVSVAPGIQALRPAGQTSGAIRAEGTATWSLRPGRQITALAVFANTGLQQLSADRAASYRYASVSLAVSWWF